MNYEKPEDATLYQPSGNFTEISGRGQGMCGNVMHLLSSFAFLSPYCLPCDKKQLGLERHGFHRS